MIQSNFNSVSSPRPIPSNRNRTPEKHVYLARYSTSNQRRMLTPIQTVSRRPRRAMYGSMVAHALLLLWLLQPASPKLVAPSFVVNGDHGAYVAHLYWPNQQTQVKTEASPGTSAADLRQQVNAHLSLKRRTKAAKAAKRKLPRPKIGLDDQTSAPGQTAQARPAGFPLGTVLDGPLTGEEVRPALQLVSPEPHM